MRISWEMTRVERQLHRWRTWFPWLAAGLGFSALALLAAPGVRTLAELWLPTCPLKSWTTFPCPFCGLTTAMVWLARGDAVQAWSSNFLGPLLALLGILWLLQGPALRLLAARELRWQLDRRACRVLTVLILGLLLLSWVTQIMQTISPDEESPSPARNPVLHGKADATRLPGPMGPTRANKQDRTRQASLLLP